MSLSKVDCFIGFVLCASALGWAAWRALGGDQTHWVVAVILMIGTIFFWVSFVVSDES